MTDIRTIAAALALAALGGLLTAQTLRLHSAQAQRAQAIADLATERATAATNALNTAETYRLLERSHHAQIDHITAQATQQLSAAQSDAGRALAARDSLRTELANYLTRHRAAAQNRAAATGGQADTTATDLLAELLRRADDRAGELAAIADTARIHGTACEAAYDSAQTMINTAGQQPPATPPQ